MSNIKRGVSVVICCFNSEYRLPTTLRYLKEQTSVDLLDWEIIIINNASTDKTKEVAQNELQNSIIQYRIVDENKPGLIHARLKGLQEANYLYISFVDDDNWVDSLWIQNIYNTFEMDENIAICGSRNYANFEDIEPVWFQDYQNNFAVGKQANESSDITHTRSLVWGAGMTIRKDVWEYLIENGFTPFLKGRTGSSLMAGEDTEICYAVILAGWKIYYNEQLTLQHYMPKERMDWSYLKKVHCGFGAARIYLYPYKKIMEKRTLKTYFKYNECFILVSLFLLLDLVKYKIFILFSNKFSKNNLIYNAKKCHFLELFKIGFSYKNLYREVSNAKWVKK